MTIATLPVLGGQYRCAQNKDGSWNVYDVPVFGEVAAGEAGNEMPIDSGWHAQAVSNHFAERRDEFLPPLHVNHNDPYGGPAPDVERAGFANIRRVGKIPYRGRMMSAMFADFLAIPPSVFNKIQSNQMPYCSAEISNYNKNLIKSVALLDKEPPHFKFPLITVKDGGNFSDKSTGGIVVHTFGDWGKPMPGYEDQQDPNGGNGGPPTPPPGPPAPPNGPPGAGAAAAPGAAQPVADPTAIQPAADPTAMPPWGQEMAALISSGVAAAIREAMGGNAGTFADGETDDDDEDVDSDRSPAIVDEADMKKETENFADLRGELAGLKAQMAARDKKDKEADLLIHAEDTLSEFELSADDRGDIKMFADRGDSKGLDIYLAAYKRNAPLNPSDGDSEFESIVNAGKGVEAELQIFADKGPDALAQARKLHSAYKNLQAAGHARMEFKDFVISQEQLALGAGS